MKYKSNLTKRYYFPIVEGSNVGYDKTDKGFSVRAFLNYIFIPGNTGFLYKVEEYNQKGETWRKIPSGFKGYYGPEIYKKMYADLHCANKYLNRQYNRLDRYRQLEDKTKYTNLFHILMKKSMLFNLVIFIRKLPDYAVNYTPKKCIALVRNIMRKNKRGEDKVKFMRIYLAEYNLDGTIRKYRPLGVPSRNWRVIAAMYEFYLVNLWSMDWSPNQFACMPKRGVGDAWIKILDHIINGKVTQILGFDLAKFFDTVYVSNVRGIMTGCPDWIIQRFERMVRSKPILKEEDITKELERNLNIEKERVPVYWPMVEDFMTGSAEQLANTPAIGFPQGLNFSPIMACRALQNTGALDREDITMFMDDGVICQKRKYGLSKVSRLFGGQLLRQNGNLRELLSGFSESLNTMYSGIGISESKSEFIMSKGRWIKPLKFLGCEYDGETFVANTRKGGLFVVNNAKERFEEIVEWLKIHGKDLGYKKQVFNKYIAQGYNREVIKGDAELMTIDRLAGIGTSVLSMWNACKTVITKIPRNSLEGYNILFLSEAGMPFHCSTNTMSMANAHFLLNYASSRSSRNRTEKWFLTNGKLDYSRIHASRRLLLTDL